jgi:hypothetical protein
METKLVKSLHLTPDGDKDKHHMLSENNGIVLEETSTDGQTLTFKVKKQALISHTEHDLLVLDTGRYCKTNQVEYNPFDNTVAYVFD